MASQSQLDHFFSFLKSADKSPATLASYQNDLKQFSKWFESINNDVMRLLKITPTDLRQYKRHMIDVGLKPQTINRRLQSLASFLSWGWATGRVKNRYPLPKKVKRVINAPKWLSKNQQNQLLRHIEQHGSQRDIAIIKILLNTGIRVSELCTLKWTHVVISDRKGRITITSGKGEKYREIPLNKDARVTFESLKYAEYAGSDAFIFEGQRGVLSSRGVQLALKRLLQYSEFSAVSPHQLICQAFSRHTYLVCFFGFDSKYFRIALV